VEGYPKERVIPEQRNARILNEVKAVVYKPLIQVLKEIDQDFLKETIATENFTEYFSKNAEHGEVRDYILSALA